MKFLEYNWLIRLSLGIQDGSWLESFTQPEKRCGGSELQSQSECHQGY